MQCDLCGKEVKESKELNNGSPFMGFVCHKCNQKYVIPMRMFMISKDVGYAKIGCDGSFEIYQDGNKITYEEIEKYLTKDKNLDLATQQGQEINILYNKQWGNGENHLMNQLMHTTNVWYGNVILLKH